MGVEEIILEMSDSEPSIAVCLELAKAKDEPEVLEKVESILINDNFPTIEDKTCAVGLYFAGNGEYEDARSIFQILSDSEKASRYLNLISNLEDYSASREFAVHTATIAYRMILDTESKEYKAAKELAVKNLTIFQKEDLDITDFALRISNLEFDLDIVVTTLKRFRAGHGSNLLSIIAHLIDKPVRVHILEMAYPTTTAQKSE